ncbi:MAG: hypothetical protein Ct9H90mP16_05130 [Candidatus Poseidoniales archaeon]|nr:MAG: hypothetical protein Ct9H90mP16_05130 [Candidatus Poseidoniales archaeon]
MLVIGLRLRGLKVELSRQDLVKPKLLTYAEELIIIPNNTLVSAKIRTWLVVEATVNLVESTSYRCRCCLR